MPLPFSIFRVNLGCDATYLIISKNLISFLLSPQQRNYGLHKRYPECHHSLKSATASNPKLVKDSLIHYHLISSSNTTATLPHFPSFISLYASATLSSVKRCVTKSSGWIPHRTIRSTTSSIFQILVTHEP